MENKDLIGPHILAVLSVQGFSLRKRGERSVAKLLLRLTSCCFHNVNSVVIKRSFVEVWISSLRKFLDFREFERVKIESEDISSTIK